MIVTVSEKGQLLIPVQLRRTLGICAGSRLEITPEPNGFKVLADHARKTKGAKDCIEIAAYSGVPIPIEEMAVAKY